MFGYQAVRAIAGQCLLPANVFTVGYFTSRSISCEGW